MEQANGIAWIEKIRRDLDLPKPKHIKCGCPDRRYSRAYQIAAKRAAQAKRARVLGAL
ncbi:hypothetical protein [Salinivibrio sp. PR919]|uniref:hypothetical protein n=1 Tax=Salinivibrio sp. PR919 TaxID=1909491 RepID=UPI0013016883|nr:hypothetical protein [Salinivibrio sp. PR919]